MLCLTSKTARDKRNQVLSEHKGTHYTIHSKARDGSLLEISEARVSPGHVWGLKCLKITPETEVGPVSNANLFKLYHLGFV